MELGEGRGERCGAYHRTNAMPANRQALSGIGARYCTYDSGVLTMQGLAPSAALKRIAEALFRRVKGIARVVNEIEVAAADGWPPPYSRRSLPLDPARRRATGVEEPVRRGSRSLS